LAYISLTAKDVELFFIYLLAICTPSFEKYLFNSFTHLLTGLFFLVVFNFFGSLCILDTNSLFGGISGKYFLPYRLTLHFVYCFSCYTEAF
jgi:hypothetical protein